MREKLYMESLEELIISFIKGDYNKKYKITKFKKRTVFSVYKEQIKSFKFLEINVIRNLSKEIKNQTTKIDVTSGYLRDTIWKNQSKIEIYKTYVRPIMRYAMEMRTDQSH